MLIGIDASRAVTDHPTGTETYSRCLIRALVELASPRYRFRLYFRTPPPPGLFTGVETRVIPFPRLWTHLRLGLEMALHPPDLLFVPAHVLPPVRPRLTLVTVHDLGYLHFPRTHPRGQWLYLSLSTLWNAHVATHILADSEATRADLISHYNIPPQKITVAYPGFDDQMTSACPIEDVRTRYGIGKKYFLYLGTLHPRKNLSRLIAAFASLPPDTLLVLAGKEGWHCKELFAQIEQLGLEERVLFTGYVRKEEKTALLRGALALVFPSLYEGFGLPVLEAQACDCPVITSTTSSLPEVAGDAAILVDPADPEAIASAMLRLLSDSTVRQSLIEKGRENVKRFSWINCARTVLEVIEQIAHPVV
ncbi:MAG: glycosyltransferase family 4 protein [Anaerolineae bacterium]|nr:glycosyltransferase family 4 protein [Anaerolineae bacterium]